MACRYSAPAKIAYIARFGDRHFTFQTGIRVDRGTETFRMVEKHIQHAIEFVENRHYERHWGFDNCLIPFLFTAEVRRNWALTPRPDYIRRGHYAIYTKEHAQLEPRS